MKLFKNEVGRPSNETLKKRKIVIASIIAVVMLLIGGISFFVVRNLGNIDGLSKKAAAGRFTVTQLTNNKNCYKVEPPANEKYWAVHVYYKNPSNGYFSNALIKKYFDNNKDNYTVCFKPVGKTDTFRILVRLTKDKSHKLKGNPNNWKPNGYLVNSSIGWAYKDYKVNWNSNKYNSGPTLQLIENSPTVFKAPGKATIKFKHNYAGTLYYKFTNYNYSTAGYKQKCSPIKQNETKSIDLTVNKNSPSRSTTFILYSDYNCTKELDRKQSKTYKFSTTPAVATAPAKKTVLKVNGPTTYIYTSAKRLSFNYSYSGDSSVMFLKLSTYANKKINFQSNCIAIKRGQARNFTLDVSKSLKDRYARLELYSDTACRNKVQETETEHYIYMNDQGNTYDTNDYLKYSSPSPNCFTKKSNAVIYYTNNTSAIAYYEFSNYGVKQPSLHSRKALYTQKCSKIGAKTTNKLTLTVDNKDYQKNRYSEISLYADSSCKVLLSRKMTSVYHFKKKC